MKTIHVTSGISIFILFLFILCLSPESYADEMICPEPASCLDEAIEAYKNGRNREALDKYKYIADGINDQKVAGISSFMAGRIMSELMLEGAEAYLGKAYSTYPLIADYALFIMADVMERNGDYNEAAYLYRTVFSSYRESVLQKKALLKAADTYLAAGSLKDSLETYEDFLALYPKDRSVPSALYGIGTCYLLEGKFPLANDYFKRVWIEYPSSTVSSSAKKGMDWLIAYGKESLQITISDYFMRGERFFEAGLYTDAITEYNRFLSNWKGRAGREVKEAYFKIALSNFNLRSSDEAEEAFESFLYKFPDHYRSPEALYWLGKTYLREGKEDAFIKSSKGFIRLYKKDKKRPEVLYRLGIIYAENGDVKSAVSAFDRVIREYPGNDFASDSRWAKGWLYYKKQDYKKSLAMFNNILDTAADSSYISRTLYWKAKVMEKINEIGGMEKSLCLLCSKFDGSFYCLFAQYYYNIQCLSSQDITGMEITDNLSDDYLFSGNPGNNDERIKLFFYLGLRAEAIEEIKWFKLENTGDIEQSITIASMLSEMGEYNLSLRTLYLNLSKEILNNYQSNNTILSKLMYPAGYSEFVNTYAAENGIDPLLIYALIREESRFNEEAISIAGAIGLMQIMPQTAATIMNDTYGGRDTLFSPELNIALGTRFFAELLKRYKGNFILALAGYNAGPHIVSKWLEDREGLGVDEFIEDIPYKETREYVKRVFKSYMKYSLSLKPIHTVSPPLIQSGLEGADVIDTQE